MAVAQVLARVARDPFVHLPVNEVVDQLCEQVGYRWRERMLTPLVTIRLFVLQVLHANTSITHLRHLAKMNFSPASYCEARERLPIILLQCLLHRMKDWAARTMAGPPMLGNRLLVVDGSTASMPDAPGLLERFGLPRGQKPGIGYPMARIMGLLDAATGLFVELLALPLFTHDMRGAVGLHRGLLAGDILLGDRAFCSFTHFCLLNARGVFGCFRLHQRRKNLTRGLQQWKKPSNIPAWMTAAQFAALPASITVRIVRYAIEQKGYRTRHVIIATTLLDERQWPDQRIAEFYGNRWPIETCFNHLKTTLKMDQLKCKTVDGVLKELAVYLIVYNLVRLVMLKAAVLQGVSVQRISFVDAARALAAWLTGSDFAVPLVTNPPRPGRQNPRVIRRRKKEYDLMTKPRSAYRQDSQDPSVTA